MPTPIAVVFLSVLSFTLFGCSKEKEAPPPPPKPEVSVITMTPRDVPIHYEFVGQTKGSIDAEVRARVDGVILSIDFEDGKEVQKDQLLYVLDPAPFKALVAEARGKLAEAETRLTKAQSDVARYRPLAKINAVSQKDLDAAVAQEGVARGSVDAAKAGVEAAEIKLGYTQIRSPITGIIGISKAKVGELVGVAPNPVILNTVSQLDPIYARFSLNEREFLYFIKLQQKEQAAGQSAQRDLELILADGNTWPEKGKLVSIDRQVDPATGSLTLEASFPNPQKILRPGLFAKVKTIGEMFQGALTVPRLAVKELQGQYSVFVISPEGQVDERTVKIGADFNDSRIVESGLRAGELVAVDSLQRLRPGMEVVAKKMEA